MLNVENYFIEDDLRIDRSDTRNGIGGGLLVYVRKDTVVRPIDLQSSFNQYCAFQIVEKNNSQPLNVTLVYRSPSTSAENTLELAKIVEECAKNSLIIGDYNLPALNLEDGTCDSKSRPVFSGAVDRFLTDLVTFPTHVRGNRLDNALADCDVKNKVFNVENIGNLGNSDHAIVKIELTTSSKFNATTELVRDWRKGDVEGLEEELKNVNFRELFQGKNANSAWIELKDKIEDTINRYIPLAPRRKQGDPPWLSRAVKRLINRKQKFWKRFSKNRNDMNFVNFKTAEKLCKRGVSAAKRKFERNIANSGNKRPFTAYVKSKTKSRSNVGPLKVGQGLVSGNKDMAQVLNNYFTSVYSKEPPGEVPVAPKLPSTSVLSNIYISAAQVKKKLLALKPNSAPGPDKITPRFLQSNADALAPALAHVFNKSLQEGTVPDDWRTANVTPIFKKGTKGDPGNYRPVSLTSVPCRVMESCVRDEIVDHVVRNSLIKDSQHGFMRKKSCTTNLLQFLETLTDENDRGNAMDVVYLDFSKAFDKVPHRRLLEKFKAHSVDGKVLDWIQSWLANRTQRTVLNGESSDWAAVTSGVPQGSVLGPLAFVIFINDIDAHALLITLLNKFADDTKCGNVIKDQSDVTNLQQCLDDLVDWAVKWGMAFNVQKCKVMHLGRSNPKATYTMNGSILKTTEAEKDIGVKVHCSLRPSLQCKEAAQRGNAVLGQISRSFHYRDRKTFVQLYKQYVRPHLEFAVPAWSPWTIADIQTIERVQQRAIRMVSGLQSPTYEGRLKELGLLSLEDRRTQFDLVQTFKIIRGFDDVRSDIWFDLVGDSPGRVTRATNDPLNIVSRNPRCDIRKKFFSQRVIEKWNELHSEIKNSRNVACFKSYITAKLLN